MRGASIGAMRDAAFTVVEDVNWSVAAGRILGGRRPAAFRQKRFADARRRADDAGARAATACSAARREILARRNWPSGCAWVLFSPGGQLFNQLTIAENVALPLRYQKNLTAAAAARTVEVLLELLELAPLAGLTPSNVAANWRQRAALARALVLKPELLLLDSPLAGLGATAPPVAAAISGSACARPRILRRKSDDDRGDDGRFARVAESETQVRRAAMKRVFPFSGRGTSLNPRRFKP